MSILEAAILGIVQGLAEFLPISSSGHLALLQNFFDIEGGKILAFTTMLHFGTLVAVFIVYWSDIWALIKELGATFKDIFTGKGLRPNANPTRKLGLMIIVGTIPAAVFGLLLNDYMEKAFTSILLIGICLIITGTFLWFAEKIGKNFRDIDRMNYRNAVTIGIFQAIALLPGISRSGATITGGLLLGLTRELAVKFAFLVSIPSILGAFILEVPDALDSGIDSAIIIPLIVGVVCAAISGVIAIKFMIKVVTGKKLFIFSIYTWLVGIAVVIYSIVG